LEKTGRARVRPTPPGTPGDPPVRANQGRSGPDDGRPQGGGWKLWQRALATIVLGLGLPGKSILTIRFRVARVLVLVA